MKTIKIIFVFLSFSFLTVQCNFSKDIRKFQKQAKQNFADQHFKTAVALIELHKIRFGEYPESLDSLKYTGDWDRAAFSSVDYQKLDSGYVLDLNNTMGANPRSFNYPAEFWQGLGIVRSNVK